MLAELEKQIGQPELKQQVASLLASVRAAQAKEAAGLGEAGTLLEHLVFTGPPGTGKTTIARLIARLYRSLGLLKSGRVIEVDRGDLVAGYVGQTAPKTTAKIEEAMGGVLFIDEAYSLAGGGPNDLGSEAIDTLLKRMEDDRGEFLVIAAGYPDQMQDFLKSNPGLPSRFTKTIAFQPYSVGELVAIAGVMAAAKGEHLTSQAEALLNTRLVVAQMGGAFGEAEWGNARTIRNIVDEAGRHRSLRLFGEPGLEPSPEELTTLTAADVAVACAASRLGTADPGAFVEPEPEPEPEPGPELELEPESEPNDLSNDTHHAGDPPAQERS